ncbi:DUF1173 domain-containing protein [Pantoea sp. Bo_2]|uniref:DUF1173 domain-containing protein n=1 Tax=Candidatus Pantoea gossypiicola TaxID=2608008 RepID=A0AB34CES9_9GAMM|nr:MULTISPECIES: DUF1173 domain-containing protein [Pantoea]KAA5923413.1 DUF1173 domain-containing protein [Pantoea sp. VH_8]KAA5929156.1 DUF1173 domain-containing protein [Pantoea sp. VH_4]KAA5942283.1 DUF1173 domain-containing protein [Pantoea sp. VH_3]KAA5950139.1 DUF1173 domain-containing protein [Pantoea sp. VH_25]KAA5955839.1 DUF1173 domain-containing protein [Pantoea sp. VH_16]
MSWRWRLQQTAARIRIGRVPLEESLLLMAMKDMPQVIANREHLRANGKNKRRRIIIFVLAGVKPVKHDGRLYCRWGCFLAFLIWFCLKTFVTAWSVAFAANSSTGAGE